MKKEERKQKNFNKLVGRIGNDYYFCDYIFIDGKMNNELFQGATGTVLNPVSKEEYEERTDPESEECLDYFKEIWQMSVQDDNTELGLQEWVEQVLNIDGDEAVFDFSGYNLWEQLRDIGLNEDDYPVFECVGGGRSFDSKMKFDEVYNKDLWRLIKAVESKEQISLKEFD